MSKCKDTKDRKVFNHVTSKHKFDYKGIKTHMHEISILQELPHTVGGFKNVHTIVIAPNL